MSFWITHLDTPSKTKVVEVSRAIAFLAAGGFPGYREKDKVLFWRPFRSEYSPYQSDSISNGGIGPEALLAEAPSNSPESCVDGIGSDSGAGGV